MEEDRKGSIEAGQAGGSGGAERGPAQRAGGGDRRHHGGADHRRRPHRAWRCGGDQAQPRDLVQVHPVGHAARLRGIRGRPGAEARLALHGGIHHQGAQEGGAGQEAARDDGFLAGLEPGLAGQAAFQAVVDRQQQVAFDQATDALAEMPVPRRVDTRREGHAVEPQAGRAATGRAAAGATGPRPAPHGVRRRVARHLEAPERAAAGHGDGAVGEHRGVGGHGAPIDLRRTLRQVEQPRRRRQAQRQRIVQPILEQRHLHRAGSPPGPARQHRGAVGRVKPASVWVPPARPAALCLRHARAVPRLLPCCRGRLRPLPVLRVAPRGRACRAVRAVGRACRLRRLLRQRREARPARAADPPGHRRRRQARRGLGLLLHRAHPRRAQRHADVQGAVGLPRCRGHQARHGEIRHRGPAHPRHDGGADAAGAAAVDRRGGARPVGHAGAARRAAGGGAGALRRGGGARGRRHRLDRPGGQPADGEAGGRTRQAARLRGDRRRGSRRLAGAAAGLAAARRRPRPGEAAGRRRGSARWGSWARSIRARRRRASARTGRRWPPARAARISAASIPTRETKSISAETTFETDLAARDGAGSRAVAAVREAGGAAAATRSWRRRA